MMKAKNLLITPHVAGKLTLDCTKDKNVEMFLEDLQNFASGKVMKYIVDKKLGY
ncbi:hypothetical protein [Treponema saccharophilum]|nr:hypothetical protein [Treponema saccharophilum]